MNATNEVVLSRAQEVVRTPNCPLPTTEGFYVLRNPYAPRKTKEVKAEKPAKTKPKSEGKRGRPPVYNGTQRRIVAAALRHHGLTKGLVFLRKERKLQVSLTLARSVAKQFGIKFTKGRPAEAA